MLAAGGRPGGLVAQAPAGAAANRDSANRDSANRDSANRDSANRDSANRDSANRDSANRDSANRDPANRDPARAEIVTRDVHNFWRAYDAAQQAPDSAGRVAAYRDLYVRAGSPGLADWTRSRLADQGAVVKALVARGWTMDRIGRAWKAPATDSARVALFAEADPLFQQSGAEQLAAAVTRRPHFYAGIRRGTLALDSLGGAVDEIRGAYRGLAALYPDAVFPPVYFLVGRLTSGGTTGPSGILLGAEMRGADPATPRDELTEWERGAVSNARGIPHLVAHELMHVEQQAARRADPRAATADRRTLLAQSLDEGCADLLADLVTTGPAGTPRAVASVVTASDGEGTRTYGLTHERELWNEFRPVMLRSDAKGWLYEGDAAKGRPADLGYFVGARICRAYYERAEDKARAVRDILVMADPKAFAEASGYAP